MNPLLSYIFWPNPGNADYTSPKALALIIACVLLVVGSFVLSRWRKRLGDQSLRKLSRSWASASLWFGLVGLVLIVARVEEIQFVAMRLWWIIWGLLAVIYIAFQIRTVRARHYTVLPSPKVNDPRSDYLPKSKPKRR